jgi:hypothetical protein
MKNGLFIVLIAVLAVSCLNKTDKEKFDSQQATAGTATNVDESNFTSIQWMDSAKKLGKIVEGQNLQLNFKFKNTGDKPLIIQNVSPSCGCTVADYPKTPIAPGEEAEISGSFDSKGKLGFQRKTISVFANTKGGQRHELSFEVEVQKAKS